MMQPVTRVAIVDDHPLFRGGVAQTLGASPGIQVVGEGENAQDAIRLVDTLAPDVLTLDLTIPGGGGLAVLRAVGHQSTRILILTASEHDDDLLAALEAGARGYALKGVGGDDLVRIVQAVAAGETYVPPGLAAGLLIGVARGDRNARASTSPLEELSERERQVLDLLASGQSNREIGEQLHLTEKTVKHYVTGILQKLNVRNRVEAALQARELGARG